MCAAMLVPECYDSCIFKHEERMSIKIFYYSAKYCEIIHNEGMCANEDISDWESFVDIAELLWHPRAYMYKAALKLLILKKLAEEDTVENIQEFFRLIHSYTIDGNIEMIREAITNNNTEAGKDPITERARILWKEAERYKWRDEEEWQEIRDLLNDREFCEAIGFGSFKANQLVKLEEKGMKWRSAFTKGAGFIPASVKVSVEDKSMTDPKSVDVLLCDERSGKSIAIELKQWTDKRMEPDDNIGFIVLGRDGSEYAKMHPVIQAAFYAMLINTGEYKNKDINIDNPLHLDSIGKEVRADTRERLKEAVKEGEIKPYIQHIIDNMPDDDPSCIPLAYLHNQYYDKGLLYKLVKKRGSDLNRLYNACLKHYRIGGDSYYPMYTHNRCERFLKIIKEWFNE